MKKIEIIAAENNIKSLIEIFNLKLYYQAKNLFLN